MVDKISNARKKELEQPDPFLEALQEYANASKKYRKQIIWVLCAVVAVVSVFSGTIYSIKRSEEKASGFLAQTLSRYSDADPVKGYETVKDDVGEFLESYPNTAAATQARVRFAEIAFKASKYEEAHKMYLAALDDFKKDASMGNLLMAALGRTCQALERHDEAEKWFRKISGGKSPLLKGEALFNLGVLLADKGDTAESRKLFETLVSDHEGSFYKPMVEARLND
ncbi:MAG: tetratricopeptide repeat protein [Desulfobacteraceae bacterium]|nr:tetratricopeptide repeat protein [Desulfobacteraceae bacterium]